jgi:uncharacterized protein YraI
LWWYRDYLSSRVTPQSFSLDSTGHIRLIVASIVTLKISSLYNNGHNNVKSFFQQNFNSKCTRIKRGQESLMLFALLYDVVST